MVYILLINPYSKRFTETKLNKIKKNFKDKRYIVLTSEKKDLFSKQLPELLEENKKEKVILVAVGGDGTINIICNILANIEKKYDISLGIIPTGTANILAKEFDIAQNVEKAIEIVLNAPERDIRLSKINDYYFVFSCGIGFDGTVVKEVNLNLKEMSGSLAYLLKGIEILKKNIFTDDIEVEFDNIVKLKAKSIVINRIQRYGIDKKIFKTAYILSDYFLCAIFKKVDFLTLIKFFQSKKSTNFTFRKAKIIKIKSPQKIPVQVDGEYLDIIPQVITVSNKTIKFILP